MLKKAYLITLLNMCLLSIYDLHAMEAEQTEKHEATIIDGLQARGLPLHLIARIGHYLPRKHRNLCLRR